MCGIVGYVGSKQAPSILMDGLSKLEYRGYDSAGIAVHDGTNIQLAKSKGKLKNLAEKLEQAPLYGTLGIGHTRWATHGAPSDVNSHPHFSGDHAIAVVHNGIIENYLDMKAVLQKEGYVFLSETDTEVAAHLIDAEYKACGDFLQACLNAAKKLQGAYALGVLCKDAPDRFVVLRKNCPLVVGLGEGENFAASDIPALLQHTREVYFLEDGEAALLTKDSVTLFNTAGDIITRPTYHVTWDMDAAEKGGYDHFMIKEIHEQPEIIREVLGQRLSRHGIELGDIHLSAEDLKEINRIYIVACGTAYHAGLVGKYLLERVARIPVVAEVASEFRYKEPLLDEHTLLIVVSQSGETADTLEALRIAKKGKARVLAVVNAVGSSMAREADDVFYILAGPEISVASTKAFTAQVAAMELIACHIALTLGRMTPEAFAALRQGLYLLPEQAEAVISKASEIQALTNKYQKAKNVFFIGRGLDYLISMEGSLKLKEIAYLHSEAYAAGELKHGPIAMIEDSTLVIALATQEELFEKTLSNIQEVKARGAKVIAIVTEGNRHIKDQVNDVIEIPAAQPLLLPILATIPTQLFAYYMALGLGTDIDKPRNLAKSVTVE